jgi:hypothetical protein
VPPPYAQLKVSSSPYGIGYPGSVISQQNITQIVPPHGQITLQFEFTPSAGHVCLYAQIINEDGTPGDAIGQNTDTIGLPSGGNYETPFFVYGHSGSDVNLTITEMIDDGTGTFHPLLPGQPSWHPKLRVLDAAVGPVVPTAAPITLHGLGVNAAYVTLLQVHPVAGSHKHKFTVTGTVSGNFVGEVDTIISAGPALSAPVVLKVNNVNLYNRHWPFNLIPPGVHVPRNTHYRMSAVLHNFSSTPAYNTIVRFWQSPGGLAPTGTLLDTQLVTIPANSSIEVFSRHNFTTATGVGHDIHRCAVVSIYNPLSECTSDATDFWHIPFGNCSGWRNTDTFDIWGPWMFNLNFGAFHPVIGPGPVELEIIAKNAGADWRKDRAVQAVDKMFLEAGVTSKMPHYLLSPLNESLPVVDLKIQVKSPKEQIAGRGNSKYVVDYGEGHNGFEISGDLPEGAQPGDTIIVQVNAHFKGTEKSTPRTIGFTQIMHVVEKRKK